jgi:hypothetical protein
MKLGVGIKTRGDTPPFIYAIFYTKTAAVQISEERANTTARILKLGAVTNPSKCTFVNVL